MITRLIRTTVAVMLNSIVLMDDVNPKARLLAGDAVLAKTYAKVYYRGGGWYAISGYASDGADVYKMIELINDLNAHNAVLKEGGYYFAADGEICGTYSDPAKVKANFIIADKVDPAHVRYMLPA